MFIVNRGLRFGRYRTTSFIIYLFIAVQLVLSVGYLSRFKTKETKYGVGLNAVGTW